MEMSKGNPTHTVSHINDKAILIDNGSVRFPSCGILSPGFDCEKKTSVMIQHSNAHF